MKTLIAYTTKYGCAEKCAEVLKKKLVGEVDLFNLKEVSDLELSQYDKVIIGGSIYAGKVQKDVSEFCSKNTNLLIKKKVGLFICGMLKDKTNEELKNSFPSELIDNAIVKEFFGGEFRFKNMNALERFMVKMVAKGEKNLPVIDMKKDFSAISEENIVKLAESMNRA